MQELLLWVQQISHHAEMISPTTIRSSGQSSIVLILYLLTYKRSQVFLVAFLFCEFMTKTDFIGLLNYSEMHSQYLSYGGSKFISFSGFYGTLFYLATMLTWLMITGLQIKFTRNKSLLFWCGTMIVFLLAMAADSLLNANTETYIWRNYASIILCIHVGLILSLYRPATVINGVVDKFRNAISFLRNNYAMSYFWYTVRYELKTYRWL